MHPEGKERQMIIRRNVSKTVPLFLVGLWCGTAAHAAILTNEPTGELTLAQAQGLADARHPELHAGRLESLAAESRVRQAAIRPNPGLAMEAESFGGKDDLQGFDGAEYTVQLEQTLELGGKRGMRIRAAEAEKQLAGFDLAAKRLDIRAETGRRFVAVQGTQERLALSKESVSLAEEFVLAVEARVRAGKAAPMEEDKAQILLAQQRVAVDSAQRDLQVARVQLSAMWGSTTPTFARASGDLQTVLSLPELAAVTARMAANPDLARWAAELEQRQAVLGRERAARVPDVTLAGGLRRYSETDSEAFVAGISVPLPVFDRNQGKIREAILLVQKAEQQRRAAEVEAMAALTGAYQALSAALTRIETLKRDVVPRSKSVFDSVQKAYAEGKYTYLDVLDARRTFFDARAEYVEALVSGHKARADVERFVGDALPVMGKN
jgi:cobalt-zinc-cadmium efflux system outer membrane protein